MANALRHRLPFLFVTASTLCLLRATAAYAESEGGEKVYQRLTKSAVWIISPRGTVAGSPGVVQVSSGSGSFLDARLRLVLTNYHVVEERDQVRVFFPHYQAGKSGKAHIVAERHVLHGFVQGRPRHSGQGGCPERS